jgi:hypothetical protein
LELWQYGKRLFEKLFLTPVVGVKPPVLSFFYISFGEALGYGGTLDIKTPLNPPILGDFD